MASDRPSSDIVFSVNPNAQTATNEASTDTGSARPVMTVDRHELRNRNTTATVSAAPSNSALCTLATESATRTPLSCTTRRVTPAGSVCWISATRVRTASATAVVLKPVDFRMSMPTASSSLKSANERGSSVPSLTSATSPRRTIRPLGLGDDDVLELGGLIQASLQPDRALVELALRAGPTGTARFCACSACTTCPTLTPLAWRSRGRSSTTSSRSTAPARLTVATPLMPRSRRVMPGSASRVSSALVRPGDDSVSDTIGLIGRIELRQHRLFHLRRQLVPDRRRSCRGSPASRLADPWRSRTPR